MSRMSRHFIILITVAVTFLAQLYLTNGQAIDIGAITGVNPILPAGANPLRAMSARGNMQLNLAQMMPQMMPHMMSQMMPEMPEPIGDTTARTRAHLMRMQQAHALAKLRAGPIGGATAQHRQKSLLMNMIRQMMMMSMIQRVGRESLGLVEEPTMGMNPGIGPGFGGPANAGFPFGI